MHPTHPTLELACVIKTFEVNLGVTFLEGLLRIKNALVESFDTHDDQAFSEAIARPLSSTLGQLVGRDLTEKVKDAIERQTQANQKLMAELSSKRSKGDGGEVFDEEEFFDLIEENVAD